jgi:probable HAF family extracellular repeat protein
MSLHCAPLYNVTTLPTGGGFDFTGINNSGQLTGSPSFIFAGNHFTPLGTLGGSFSQASAINEKGEVTGSSDNGPVSSFVHAFLYTNGQMIDLGTLGGTNSYGMALNDQGHVTGYSDTSGGAQHAFLYRNGVMTDLSPLGAFNSRGNGINNSDEIAGTALVESSDPFGAHIRSHAFLYSGGQSVDLGSLGGGTGSALAINDGGQVTGSSATSTGSNHAFLYTDGAMLDLGTLPGFPGSFGESINNHGQITGQVSGSTGRAAFIWADGVMQNLNDLIDPALGITLGEGIDINDKGQILVRGETVGGSDEYLLTPVPEPGTLAFGLSVLALTAARRLRFRFLQKN